MNDVKGSVKTKQANALNWKARGICEVKQKDHFVCSLQCVMKPVMLCFH